MNRAYTFVLVALTTALFTLPASAQNFCFTVADSGGGNGGNDLLRTINLANNAQTVVGTGTGTNNIEAIAFQPGDDVLYAANAGRLGTINITTGVYTDLFNIQGQSDVDGLTFDAFLGGFSGNTIMWGSQGSRIFRINIANGNTSAGVTLQAPFTGVIDDIAIDPTTGIFYVVTSTRTFRVDNVATGAVTDLGAHGVSDAEGLGYDFDGNFYVTNGNTATLFELDDDFDVITPGIFLTPGGDFESLDCMFQITCSDTTTGGIDNGCTAALPACVMDPDSGTVGCAVCENDQPGGDQDDACPAAAPICDVDAGALGNAPFCIVCEDKGPGVDPGCPGGLPLCDTTVPGGECQACINDQTGTTADTGCGGATPLCDAAAGQFGSTCVACDAGSQCGDANACTTDQCSAAGSCSNPPVSAGVSCGGGDVCDGASSCVECINDNAGGGTDAGCIAGTPLCNGGSGGGAGSACFVCQNNQSGTTQDRGCSAATPQCNGSAGGGFGTSCSACTADSQCDDGNPCTADSCGGGTCTNAVAPVGSSCGGGNVCDSSAACVSCINNIAGGGTDAGCGGGLPLCNGAAGGGAGTTCFDCENTGSGTTRDRGCPAASPLCAPTSGDFGLMCFSCVNNNTGNSTDTGCSAATPFCSASAGAFGSQCLGCVANNDCDDGNQCTTNTCSAGTCASAPVGAGSMCSQDGGSVCDGANACVTCLNTATGGTTDLGCPGGTPICNGPAGGGAGTACGVCLNDSSGTGADSGCSGARPLCDASTNSLGNVCLTCQDPGAGTDLGCGGATPNCDTTGGAPNMCVACIADADCSDGNECTTNSCNAGMCQNSNTAIGQSCTAGGNACNGGGSCVPCVNTSANGTDPGCPGARPFCDAASNTGGTTCVECQTSTDCNNGEVCNAANTCVPDVQCRADSDCSGSTPVCDLTSNSCVVCVNNNGGATLDNGCGATAPLCNGLTNAPGSACVVCQVTAGSPDLACSGTQPICDPTGAGGLGACVGCVGASDCDDGLSCTADVCNSGVCATSDIPAGTGCNDMGGQVCDGSGSCIFCVNDMLGTAIDTGCDGNTPLCGAQQGNAGTRCFECATAADCGNNEVCNPAGVCVPQGGCSGDADCTTAAAPVCDIASRMCMSCRNDAAGVSTDTGCAPGTPLCVAPTNEEGERCVQCSTSAQCNQGEICSAANVCVPMPGCTSDNECDGMTPVCDLDNRMCMPCRNDMNGNDLDTGCAGTTPLCLAASGEEGTQCVECSVSADCAAGETCDGNNMCVPSVACTSDAQCNAPLPVCDSTSMTCTTCRNDMVGTATDTGCGAATPLCNAAMTDEGSSCVQCLSNDNCMGTDTCNAANVCVPTTPNEGDIDDDDDGITDAVELGGSDLSNDSDADGIIDYEDTDFVTCDDNDNNGTCDALPVSVDQDQDGLPNHLDIDADGDGILDMIEGNDADHDGVADTMPSNMDENGNGLDDAFDDAVTGGVAVPTQDTDGDGKPDFLDIDSDDDGIPDLVEGHDDDRNGMTDELPTGMDTNGDGLDDAYDPVSGGSAPAQQDSDGDGYPDYLDLDSDGDGIRDIIEGNDQNQDGATDVAPMGTDADSDGLDDSFDADQAGTIASVQDTDGDGTPDYLDTDSDDDAIPDHTEAHDANQDGRDDVLASGVDANQNGLDDAFEFEQGGTEAPLPNTDGGEHPNYLDVDSDNDGIRDDLECKDPTICPYSDSDESPDYLDADSDNDGVPDSTEGHDVNADGVPDVTPTGVDADNDGLDDAFDTSEGGLVAQRPDFDDDGLFDYQDIDDDADGIATSLECADGVSPCPNGDGDTNPDYLDIDAPALDTDMDGIPDQIECGGTLDGPPACDGAPDFDGDGMPDNNDADDDGDGIPTSEECPQGNPALCDTDSDGQPDHLDIDRDNDGIPDALECETGTDCVDTDGDGTPDASDLDSDNDRVPDAIEGHDANMDGEADTQPIMVDDNNNGLDDAFDPDAGGVAAPLQNSDADTIPDWRDTDDDDDGIATALECVTGPNCPNDDGDANPDYLDADTTGEDDDNDGIPNAVECPGGTMPFSDSDCPDSDGDGMPDWNDPDDDNDGIPTASEAYDGNVDPTQQDSDLDGTPDYLDTDDDNDGVPTATECADFAAGCADTDGDGRANYRDVCGDGQRTDWDAVTTWEECDDGNTIDGDTCDSTCRFEPASEDGDDDMDGIPNLIECPAPGDLSDPVSCRDTDEDGLPDFRDIDADNDGILDETECEDGASCTDTDGDLVPDYLDLDSDGDNVPDLVEGHDADHDGLADRDPIGTDMDNDGLDDAFDPDNAGTSAPLPDTDEDGQPDWRDTDDDGDMILTEVECPDYSMGCPDADDDNRPDYLDTTDGAEVSGGLSGGALCAVSYGDRSSWPAAFGSLMLGAVLLRRRRR